ncbi:HEPN domain-containing protein [Desulfoscipio geothermicus]|uniref:HEPN domain-containing protein n=1 Tax=Desulfoscipio geothermicus DSM 3669 TaxID=1121426 RepID=A0A1I6D808_9FIRM|nr:HEPN domain-containing protein [Desulfoscipio geothermicus]SFR01548.1 HEPN domain-containing protein [Desulfoscipio geothermicus DSM 3669]
MKPETVEWLDQVDYDLDTAESMLTTGRYVYTIFMCHLAIEKTLKALMVEKTGKMPPKIHNLIRLIKLGNAKLSSHQLKFVSRLSLAGVVTRYPENLRKAISDYPQPVAREYLKNTKEVIKCLKQQIK